MVKIEGFRIFRKSLPSFTLSALERTLPHFGSGQKAGKCRLKYVIYSSTRPLLVHILNEEVKKKTLTEPVLPMRVNLAGLIS